MEEFSENTNLEIYYDLEKFRWFKNSYRTVESFDYRNFDTGKKYFDYLKVKGQINTEFIIFKKNIYSILKRLIWFSFWVFTIYKLFLLSVVADYFLLIFVLSGYMRIYQTGAWDKKSLEINKSGCEVNGIIKLSWNEISSFITIPYVKNKKADLILYVYIITNNGILYKFNFFDFTFTGNIQKKFLPVYVEYFREQSKTLA